MSGDGRPEEPHRHYQRAHRLERASEEVRWLSTLDPSRRPGLFGSLVATRGLRFAFFAILIAALAAGVTWVAMGDGTSGRLAGSAWRLEALRYGEDVLVVLRRSGDSAGYVDRPVSLAIAYVGRPSESLLEGFLAAGRAQEFRAALRDGAGAQAVRAEIRIDSATLVLEAPIR